MSEKQREAGRQELFSLMRQEHGVTCMESELTDIEQCVLSYALSHAEGEAVGTLTIDRHGDEKFHALLPAIDLEPGTYEVYTHPAPAGEPVVWPEPQEATTIEEYVGEYEYTDGEGHNYSPTETERALILDAIHGIPDHLLQPPKPAQQPVSDPDGLPSDWRRVVEGAADMLGESAKQHRGRGDNATAAMCDRFDAMLRDEILSTPGPDEREIAARAIEQAAREYFNDESGPHNLHDYLLWRVKLLRAGKEGE